MCGRALKEEAIFNWDWGFQQKCSSGDKVILVSSRNPLSACLPPACRQAGQAGSASGGEPKGCSGNCASLNKVSSRNPLSDPPPAESRRVVRDLSVAVLLCIDAEINLA